MSGGGGQKKNILGKCRESTAGRTFFGDKAIDNKPKTDFKDSVVSSIPVP